MHKLFFSVIFLYDDKRCSAGLSSGFKCSSKSFCSMSLSTFSAHLTFFFKTRSDYDKFGGPSVPHKLQSPLQSPLQPGVINFLSKLSMNSHPCKAFFSKISKLCFHKTDGNFTGVTYV